ncbi:hypothetical protein Q5752_002642 [Cryptotrichosporon argae]
MRRADLLSLPPEILTQIGAALVSASLRPPAALLATCRKLHAALAPRTNAVLYAGVFERAFDLGAARRRVAGLGLASGPGPGDGDGGAGAGGAVGRKRKAEDNGVAHAQHPATTQGLDRTPDQDSTGGRTEEGRELRELEPELALAPADIVDEMRRRAAALARVGAMVGAEQVGAVAEADLWVIYLMLLENDGKNVLHFLPGAALDLAGFLRLYHKTVSVPDALDPGYPAPTAARALVAWIDWIWVSLGLGSGARGAATSSASSGRAGDAASPLPSPSPGPPAAPADRDDADEAAFVLRPFVFACHEYGAYYAPWTRAHLPDGGAGAERGGPGSSAVALWGRTRTLAWPVLSHAAILRFFRRQIDDGPGAGDGEEADNDAAAPRPAPGSRAWDTDFKRLLACHDPKTSAGLGARDWVGKLSGCWEGEFSYFEFDAFRDMLDGHDIALYEGPFGRQRQVWRTRETYVRPAGGRRRDGHGAGTGPWTGSALRAGFHKLERVPVVPPSASTSAASSVSAPGAAADDAALDVLVRTQLDALDGWESVPADELAAEVARDNVEVLVTGTGHSAWGRFILRGRVRLWDGMVILVKEYAPDDRGRWIYRGYLTGDNVLVGRWRDSLTPEEFIGYEGTFTLSRR